jgi:hypothetical protein
MNNQNKQNEAGKSQQETLVMRDKVFHHCTSASSLKKIEECGWLFSKYFDGEGVYLSECPYDCQYHGEKILVIDGVYIKNTNLQTDDVNDGIFHRGAIPFKFCDVYDTDNYLELHRLAMLEDNACNFSE